MDFNEQIVTTETAYINKLLSQRELLLDYVLDHHWWCENCLHSKCMAIRELIEEVRKT